MTYHLTRGWAVGHAIFIDDKFPVGITLTDPSNVPDIMAQQGYGEMQPVARCDTAILDMLATQNFLSYTRNKYSMFNIMIEGISIGNSSSAIRAH